MDARSNLGRSARQELGHYQDAIREYQEALKGASPDVSPRLRFNLALAYYKSFQIPEAAAELETLRAAQPADLNLAVLLADCRLRMGEFQKAIDAVQPLEAANLEEPALNYVLGMALIQSGRVADGQIRVDRILRRGGVGRRALSAGLGGLFTAGNPTLQRWKEFSKPGGGTECRFAVAAGGTWDRRCCSRATRMARPRPLFARNWPPTRTTTMPTSSLLRFLARRGKTARTGRGGWPAERAVQVRPRIGGSTRGADRRFPFRPGRARRSRHRGGRGGFPAIGSLTWIYSALARPVVLACSEAYTCPKLPGVRPPR